MRWTDMMHNVCLKMVFFVNDTATTEIYTLSLHEALPICDQARAAPAGGEAHQPADDHEHAVLEADQVPEVDDQPGHPRRSEEHTSELQSRQYLVCRLLLEKKNTFPHLSSHTHSISVQRYA